MSVERVAGNEERRRQECEEGAGRTGFRQGRRDEGKVRRKSVLEESEQNGERKE